MEMLLLLRQSTLNSTGNLVTKFSISCKNLNTRLPYEKVVYKKAVLDCAKTVHARQSSLLPNLYRLLVAVYLVDGCLCSA